MNGCIDANWMQVRLPTRPDKNRNAERDDKDLMALTEDMVVLLLVCGYKDDNGTSILWRLRLENAKIPSLLGIAVQEIKDFAHPTSSILELA